MKNTMKKPVAIPVEKLRPFAGHPFKVKDDDEMNTLIESIQTQGVLSPLIVRPIENTDEYEVVSGHRRLHAAQKAGITEVPALIYALDRDSAAIAVVDSNLHREHILPSEKAFAYKLKMEALSHQGKRTDLTSDQVGPKLTAATISEADSATQVKRYIRLTELIPELLQFVDSGKIAFTPAVELSYLMKEEQAALVETILSEDRTPSLSQAQQMRKLSQMGVLDEDTILHLMIQPKANQVEKISLDYGLLRRFFPKSYSPKDIQAAVLRLIEADYRRRQRKRER